MVGGGAEEEFTPNPVEGPTVRPLTTADVADLGGDKELFAASEDFFADLYRQPLSHHRPVAGIGQETVQSLQLHAGVVHASEYCFREDSNGELKRDRHGRPLRYPVKGDGSVHRDSASPVRRAMPIHAQHGALASSKQARRAVADFLLEDDHLGPNQAGEGLGLNVPDYVHPQAKWDLSVTGTEDAAGIECAVSAVDGDYSRLTVFRPTATIASAPPSPSPARACTA